MKLLFDENLSATLVGRLASKYPERQHVREIGLAEEWQSKKHAPQTDIAQRNPLVAVSAPSRSWVT